MLLGEQIARGGAEQHDRMMVGLLDRISLTVFDQFARLAVAEVRAV
jgi:hypothetical protein